MIKKFSIFILVFGFYARAFSAIVCVGPIMGVYHKVQFKNSRDEAGKYEMVRTLIRESEKNNMQPLAGLKSLPMTCEMQSEKLKCAIFSFEIFLEKSVQREMFKISQTYISPDNPELEKQLTYIWGEEFKCRGKL